MMRISPVRRSLAAILLLSCVFLLHGCRKKPVHAAPPATPSPAESNPPPEMSPPEIKATPEKTPPTLTVPASPPPRPPARPRPAQPEPAVTEPEPPRPEPPRISPQYSPDEELKFRRQTNTSIAKAESNLQKMSGRKLNAAQNDMVEKIRGFLSQAQEAIRASDWFRAQNLASKAELLSEELVRSR